MIHAPNFEAPEEWVSSITQVPRIALARGLASNCVHFFCNFELWRTHLAENCMGMIGTRLHGAIMAMNAGIPAIVTNGDTRSRSCCEFLQIPWMPGEPAAPTRDGIKKLFDRVDVAHINGIYRHRYAEFARWSNRHGLNIKHKQANPINPGYSSKLPVETVVERFYQILWDSKRRTS
jgi:hypothetical protein